MANKEKDTYGILIKMPWWLILGVGIILCFISVCLFTVTAYCPRFDFSTTGQIGDTIGGLTAPIINLIGAVLIFISFRVQYDANQQQKNANQQQIDALEASKIHDEKIRQFNFLHDLLKDLKNEINAFQFKIYIYSQTEEENPNREVSSIDLFEGLLGIDLLVSRLHYYELIKKPLPKQEFNLSAALYEINYILQSFLLLNRQIQDSTLEAKQKDDLTQNIKLLYRAKLKNYIESIIKIDIAMLSPFKSDWTNINEQFK